MTTWIFLTRHPGNLQQFDTGCLIFCHAQMSASYYTDAWTAILRLVCSHMMTHRSHLIVIRLRSSAAMSSWLASVWGLVLG